MEAPDGEPPSQLAMDIAHSASSSRFKNREANGDIFDWDEVLNSGIDYSKSAGCWGPKKSAYVTREEDRWVFSEHALTWKHPYYQMTLVEVLAEYERQAEKGKRMFSWWLASLKKELKPAHKLAKTRVFLVPPLHVHLLTIKYTGDLMQQYSCMWEDYNHIIGVNPDAVWKKLGRRLENLRCLYDADFSRFDQTIAPQVFTHIFKMLDHFYCYCDTERKVVAVLLSEQENNHFLAHTDKGTHLYFMAGGNPSGALGTIFTNCEGNKLAHIEALCKLVKPMTVDIWKEHFDIVVCGDDVLFGVQKSAGIYITAAEMFRELKRQGYRPTDAAKTGNIKNSELSEVSFLKSNFVKKRMGSKEIWFRPMEKETIYKQLNWCHKKDREDPSINLQRITGALKMAAHHGRDFYDRMQQVVNAASEELGWSRDSPEINRPWIYHVEDLEQLQHNVQECISLTWIIGGWVMPVASNTFVNDRPRFHDLEEEEYDDHLPYHPNDTMYVVEEKPP